MTSFIERLIKFEKNKEKIVEKEQTVKMKEIIKKKEKLENQLSIDQNLKIIEPNKELILTWPTSLNRGKKNNYIIFTNINNSDEIFVSVDISSKYGNIKRRLNRYTIKNSNQHLTIEKKWINTLKIKIMNNKLYLTNNTKSINYKINNKKIDIIKTNLIQGKWL